MFLRIKKIFKKKETKIILILMAVILGATLYLTNKASQELNMMLDTPQRIDAPEIKEMENKNVSKETEKVLKENWTVAIFGLDSRDKNLARGNSDVIILASLNQKTGKINIVSVYRDTCLDVGNEVFHKANEAYAKGGPKQAVKMLNDNLDLQIDAYVAFDWSTVATAVNILGGVDVDITPKELTYLNAYITETVKGTGMGSVQLKESGHQHLDGIQTVAYCRIRKLDDDFQRTARQREVLSQLLKSAKKGGWPVINNLIVTVLPKTSASIYKEDVYIIGRNLLKFNISSTTGFPFTHIEKTVDHSAMVFSNTLASNVSKLHNTLYGIEDYEPSDHVKELSRMIDNKMLGKATSPSINEIVSPIEEGDTAKEEEKTSDINQENLNDSSENNEDVMSDRKAEEDPLVDETLENENIDENNDENISSEEEVSGPAAEIEKRENVKTEDDNIE